MDVLKESRSNLPPAQKASLARIFCLTLVFNVAFNGVLGGLMFGRRSSIPMWGDPSVGVDAIFTTFLLPFFSALILLPVVNDALTSGKLHSAAFYWHRYLVLEKLPEGNFMAAFCLAAASLVLVTPLAIGVLIGFWPQTFSVAEAVIAKMLYSGALTCGSVPAILFIGVHQHRKAQSPS
ncbi:MAG: hypothetical protein H7A00_03250 [Hahellaceae bacterium]|nr:hypothetical protein [Hahellaceae bacterium]